MARAVLIFREKLTDIEGNLTEVTIWRVPVGPSYPDGVRYRLAWIRSGEERPAVLYDNHAPKGHHRHVEGHEHAYDFLGPDRLQDDFRRDVLRAKGGRG
jgi:hypothetical protein